MVIRLCLENVKANRVAQVWGKKATSLEEGQKVMETVYNQGSKLRKYACREYDQNLSSQHGCSLMQLALGNCM